MLEDLGQARATSGKSALYVVGADFFERHDIQADLPERIHYGRPLKSLLAKRLIASGHAESQQQSVCVMRNTWRMKVIPSVLRKNILPEPRRSSLTTTRS